MRACVRMWVVSWVGNFAGCGIFIGLIYATGLYEGRDWYALLLGQRKVRGGRGRMLPAWRPRRWGVPCWARTHGGSAVAARNCNVFEAAPVQPTRPPTHPSPRNHPPLRALRLFHPVPQVHHSFGSTFVRGIFANWLVRPCLDWGLDGGRLSGSRAAPTRGSTAARSLPASHPWARCGCRPPTTHRWGLRRGRPTPLRTWPARPSPSGCPSAPLACSALST
jgi:hypothetical protein